MSLAGASARRRRRLLGARLPGTTNPTDMAMSSGAADPATKNVVRTVLVKQERLLDAQILQLGRQRWRDAVFATLAASILIASIAFVWSASRADGIVVAPFAVPPALAQQGVTGPVVAAQMLDRLTAMQAETLSIRPASSYGDDWSGNIKVALPYAGISIGELRTYLVNWLGRQRTLSGEVVALSDGQLAVTARISGAPGRRYDGAGLDALVQNAAEGVYEETQAFRYGVWLRRHARRDEALKIYDTLTRSIDPVERMWGLHGLGVSETDPYRAIAVYRRLALIEPTFPHGSFNIGYIEFGLGHLESACRNTARSVGHFEQWRGRLTAIRAEADMLSAKSITAACQGDHAGALKLLRQSGEYQADYQNGLIAPLTLAAAHAEVHDSGAARTAISDAGLDDPVKLAPVLALAGASRDPALSFAYADGDWPRLRDRLTEVLTASVNPRTPGLRDPSLALRPRLTEALTRTGRHAEAAATIAATPLDCDPCVRARGLAAAFAGRPAEADRWFAMLARRTPSLPYAQEAWAEAKLFRRDYAGAIRQAAAAHKLGPRWADPLKHWGDALAAQGKWADALGKYTAALERAPNWSALRTARDAAARRVRG